jgi:hypothetical protein
MTSSDGVTRYPLSWPAGWKRTTSRQHGKFNRKETDHHRRPDGSTYTRQITRDLTVANAVARLQAELDRLGASDAVISTNLRLRLDGLPRSDQGDPGDPGVALYFRLKKQDRCLACDRYWRVADNIAAIAAHIEALRAIERYGVGTLDQAFAGYAALPPAADAWWLIFNLPQSATLVQVEARFLELARAAHPDAGGSHNDMARLTAAREAARKALRGSEG